MGFIWYILCGGVAGWLASTIMSGKSSGVLFNIGLGIVGGLIGGFLFSLLGFGNPTNILGELITATVGAVLTIYLVRIIRE